MILVLAGTQDGRQIAYALHNEGFPVLVSVVTEYGRKLAENGILSVNASPLDLEAMLHVINCKKIRLIIDASHPYAVNVTKNAMKACAASSIEYLRYERPVVQLPNYDKLYQVEDYTLAAQTAVHLGKTIFLTIGSRMLKAFKAERDWQRHRLIARVLPDIASLSECFNLGFKPRDIIALQGPFSHQLNVSLYKEYEADVVITKNSGNIGGCDTKISAAMELGLPIVIVNRPQITYDKVVYSVNDVLKYVKEASI